MQTSKQVIKKLRVPKEGEVWVRQLLPDLANNRVQLQIIRNHKTGNPLCQVREPNSKRVGVVPIACQEWLAGGTQIEAVEHKIRTRTCYTFLDISCIGGRSLANASHREKLAALISVARDIRNPTDFVPPMDNQLSDRWPLFALAPTHGNIDINAPSPTSSLGIPFLQVYKNLQEVNTVYIEEKHTKHAAKLINAFPCAPTNDSGKTGKQEPARRKIQLQSAAKHRRPTSEIIVVRAGTMGPDDYVGVGVESKREGGVLVRTMDTSLKLNHLLRGTNVELYRAATGATPRVLKSIKMEARWCPTEKQWRLVCEGSRN
jgi:hypothetical protein